MIDEFARSLTGSGSAPVLSFSRRYDTSPDDLWSALTDPARLRRWLGDVSGDRAHGFDITFSDAPDSPARAEIEDCTPSHRLVVRWSWGQERASRVLLTLDPLDPLDRQGGGTLLTLEHRLDEPDHVAEYGGGWEQCFAVLAQQLGGAASVGVDEPEIAGRWDAMRRRAVEVALDLAAPPADVWRAFATADGLRHWWWTHWDDVAITADVRAGGSYRIEAPKAGIVLTGDYLTVDDPSHLSFTWRWADAEGVSVDEACDVHIEPIPEGSRLTVRHTGPWTDDSPAENYRQGWEFTLSHLRLAVENPAASPAENGGTLP